MLLLMLSGKPFICKIRTLSHIFALQKYKAHLVRGVPLKPRPIRQ